MKKYLTISVAVAMMATSLYADSNSNTGCGLGSVLIKNQDSVITQVVAVTTNATSGNQTFAISSGTLNCSKPAKLVLENRAKKFLAENMDEIAVDVAAGEGEMLDTLLSLLEVSNKEKVSQKLKENFDTIYNSDVTTNKVFEDIVAFI